MDDPHSQVLMVLGQIKQSVEGVNKRLDTLNSSVAKHEIRFGSQDILNAQMTISQSQIVKDLEGLKINDKKYNDFGVSFMSSLNTFKWLFGFLGIGNVIMFLRALGII